VAFGLDGAALGADLVSPAGRLAARTGLDGLAQDLGQDRCLADVDGPGRGEQGHRPGGRHSAQPAEFLALSAARELVKVAAAELIELGRVVSVPLAQLGGRRGVLGPFIQPGGVLAQAPGPDPVDKNASAVVRRWRVVGAADPDV
jgi:hypothetical protein